MWVVDFMDNERLVDEVNKVTPYIYNLICENKHLTVEQVMAEFDISRATVFRDYAKIKKITGAVYDKNESVWKL